MAYKIRVATKKEQLKKPDEFISTVDWLGHQIVEHAKLLWMLLGILLVVVGSVGAYWYYQQQKEIQAQVFASQAEQYYHQQVPAIQGIAPPSKEENYKKAIELYQKVIRDYPDTDSAAVARYSLGNAYLELKDFDSAISAYRAFLEQGSKNDALKGLTYQRLGYAYLSKNSPQEAVQAFESVIPIPGALNKDQAYYELGRLNERLGGREEAIKNYQEIAKRYPNSMFLSDAQARLNAMGVTEVKPEPSGKASPEGNPPAGGGSEKAVVPQEKPAAGEAPTPPEKE